MHRLTFSVAVAALSLAGASLAASAPHPSADPVIAAERAFAARGSEVAVKQAFLDYAAPDGVLVDSERGAENALASIATWPDRDNAGFIKWWPLYAGISRSGDLGFTTGAARYGADLRFTNYFTVWKKQPDGSWKWLIDMGTGLESISHGPETPVEVAPAADVKGKYPEAAQADLDVADAGLIAEARASVTQAYGRRLAPDGRIMGLEPRPQIGEAAWRAALAARPQSVDMKRLGGGVATSGDLGWSYGTARWTAADGKPAQGTWLRVWQHRKAGWVILADMLTPDR